METNETARGKGPTRDPVIEKQALQTFINWRFRSGRHGPKTPPLLFSAVLGILGQPQWTKELGTRKGVRSDMYSVLVRRSVSKNHTL